MVCNAGIARDGAFPALTDEDWDTVLRTNLDGFYNVLHPVIMPMIRRRAPGRIVTLSSVSGVMGNRGQVNYSASKAGIIGATKALAVELASREITVNCVAPGLIRTDMIERRAGRRSAQDGADGAGRRTRRGRGAGHFPDVRRTRRTSRGRSSASTAAWFEESMSASARRVVVTGFGGITALGHDWPTIERALRANVSGVVRMHEWDRYADLQHAPRRAGAGIRAAAALHAQGDCARWAASR